MTPFAADRCRHFAQYGYRERIHAGCCDGFRPRRPALVDCYLGLLSLYTPLFEISPALLLAPKASSQDNVEFGRRAARCRAANRRRSAFFKRRPDMATGTVKFFNSQKGFGFIQPEDGSKDVFVHISAVERAGMSNLNEGQKLSYDVVSERGKLAAANLQNV
jgi:CspA family cold shock protein